MSSSNFKNFSFIILLLVVLGISFGVVHIIGFFDPSSVYTKLIYGEKEK